METNVINDNKILEGLVKAGTRREAFGQLLATYQQRIYFFIRHQVKDHEETDELLQDMFLKFYRDLGVLTVNDELRQVIYELAVRTCQHYFQKQPEGSWLPKLISLLKQQEFSFRIIAEMLNLPAEKVKEAFC
jgi:hypothetical protein